MLEQGGWGEGCAQRLSLGFAVGLGSADAHGETQGQRGRWSSTQGWGGRQGEQASLMLTSETVTNLGCRWLQPPNHTRSICCGEKWDTSTVKCLEHFQEKPELYSRHVCTASPHHSPDVRFQKVEYPERGIGSIITIYCNNKLLIKERMGDYVLYSTFMCPGFRLFLCMEQFL